MVKKITERSIRKIKMVIDVEDPLKPELPLEEFKKIHRLNPNHPKYRIVTIEVLTCTEDLQPVLVSECGCCPKFFKRFDNIIFCKKATSIEY